MSLAAAVGEPVLLERSGAGAMLTAMLGAATLAAWSVVNAPDLLAPATAYAIMAVSVAVAAVAVWSGMDIEVLGSGTGGRQLLVGAGIGLALAAPVIAFAIPLLTGAPRTALGIGSATVSLATIVFVVAVAPVVEESFFAGLLFPALAQRIGFAASLAATTALFVSFHLAVYGYDPRSLAYLAVMRVALTLAAYRFGLAASIAAHAVNNAVGLATVYAARGAALGAAALGGVTGLLGAATLLAAVAAALSGAVLAAAAYSVATNAPVAAAALSITPEIAMPLLLALPPAIVALVYAAAAVYRGEEPGLAPVVPMLLGAAVAPVAPLAGLPLVAAPIALAAARELI